MHREELYASQRKISDEVELRVHMLVTQIWTWSGMENVFGWTNHLSDKTTSENFYSGANHDDQIIATHATLFFVQF